MSGQPPVQPAAPKSSVKLITTLGLIALCSGLLVVSVVEFTRPVIAENYRQALEEAVLEVVPGAVSHREVVLTAEGVIPAEEASVADAGRTLFAGYDANGALRGVAVQASGRGYADVIRILYGYDHSCRCIVGMTVLESRETPGLGDRIETDEAFQANFDALSARLSEDGSGLAQPIRTVKPNHAQAPGEIDGITGATVSANAIGRMLNESANAVLPRLVPHWKTLEGDR